ncbi:hypothetical protein [Pontibacter rugosus]|uniref:Uncharacterized protein n=1 Tax=Pontibacter rugosus TaxID=1745966 RepID=A0ABW3SPT1_9BACT
MQKHLPFFIQEQLQAHSVMPEAIMGLFEEAESSGNGSTAEAVQVWLCEPVELEALHHNRH